MSFVISIKDVKKCIDHCVEDRIEELNQQLDEAMREGNIAWAQELEYELDQLTSNI